MNEWFPLFLNLGDDWNIMDIDCKVDPMRIDVFVEFTGAVRCPICGKTCRRYDRRTRHWRDVDIRDARVNIHATVPRSDCPIHGAHEIDVPWAGKCSQLTLQFERLCYEYAMAMPPKLVERLLRVDDNTVWKIVFSEYDACAENLDLADLEVFCIDETQGKSGMNFNCIVSDPVKGRIIFATEGKDWTVLGELYSWIIRHNGHPDNIKLISADMSESFQKGVSIFFPSASVVIDHFHVHKLANDMVDKVRRSSGLKGRDAKGIRFKFLKNQSNLTEENIAKVESVLDRYSDLAVAYMIKESIVEFYSRRDPEHCEVVLRNIIMTGSNSGIKEVERFCNTLDNHFDGIVLWHRVSVTNGLAEGLNSVIQSMKTASRGFRNNRSLIALAFLRSNHRYEKRKMEGVPDRKLVLG